MVSFRSCFSVLALGVALVVPASAEAAFLFCNQTKTTIEAAFGSREDGKWLSEGWWQLEPGQCARVTNKPLTQRFYFYYARELALPTPDGREPKIWDGKYAFCTDNKAFRIEGDGNCEPRGYRKQGFREVDVGPKQKTYTLTFKE